MKCLLLLSLVAAASAMSILEEIRISEEWDMFKTRFDKNYATEQEELKRFQTFKDEVRTTTISALNKKKIIILFACVVDRSH